VQTLASGEVDALDPYAFMASIGMPQMARAVPYLGYVAVVGRKPSAKG
jgi:hypothetical protein